MTSRFVERLEGFATDTLFATYLHVHAGGDPGLFESFVRACISHQTQAAAER